MKTVYLLRKLGIKMPFGMTYEEIDGYINTWKQQQKKEVFNVKQFTKSNLKTGMIVKDMCNRYWIVLLNSQSESKEALRDVLVAIDHNGYNSLYSFNESLICDVDEFTIKEIYTAPTGAFFQECLKDSLFLIWKREEPKELTIEEIQEKLGYKIKIVE